MPRSSTRAQFVAALARNTPAFQPATVRARSLPARFLVALRRSPPVAVAASRPASSTSDPRSQPAASGRGLLVVGLTSSVVLVVCVAVLFGPATMLLALFIVAAAAVAWTAIVVAYVRSASRVRLAQLEQELLRAKASARAAESSVDVLTRDLARLQRIAEARREGDNPATTS